MSLTAFHFAPFTTVTPTVPHIIPNLLHLVHISNIHPLSAQTTHSHSPWHCLHSTVSSPVTHSIGYFHFSLPCPVHPHSAPHRPIPILSPSWSFPQFHSIYPHSAVHPHSFASGSLPHSPLIIYMAHHVRLPPGLQEAGVQNQPEVARPDHPSPSYLRVTFDGPETQEYFSISRKMNFLLFLSIINLQYCVNFCIAK